MKALLSHSEAKDLSSRWLGNEVGRELCHSLSTGARTWMAVGRGDATVGTWAEPVNINYFYQIVPWWGAGGKGV